MCLCNTIGLKVVICFQPSEPHYYALTLICELKACVFFVVLSSAATVMIKCPCCFYNGSRYGLYIFNPINSGVPYEFFNVLFPSARSVISGINRLVFLFWKSRSLHVSATHLSYTYLSKQSIPLLTPYKMGRFNLSHRYVVYVIYAPLLLSFLLAQNLNRFNGFSCTIDETEVIRKRSSTSRCLILRIESHSRRSSHH